MNKFHFDITINEKNKSNAGTKATEDCREILLSIGFKDLRLYFVKHILLFPFNLVKLMFYMIYYWLRIPSHSFIVVQYPLKGINRFFKHFIKLLKSKHCKVACLLHDLDSLRAEPDHEKISKEIENLSAYDAIVCHNDTMTKWLKDHGYKGIVQEIRLFDYLACSHFLKAGKSLNTIAFAGNLARGNFLPQLLSSNKSLHFNLYGAGLSKNLLRANTRATWCGSFSPEEIVKKLQADYGLIWDGDSDKALSGIMGNYMRLNTPHKTSLYFVAGIPVITSADAAIAPLIKKYKVGILVNNLAEVAAKVMQINPEEYTGMRENVLRIRKKLVKGEFLKEAIVSIQTQLFA